MNRVDGHNVLRVATKVAERDKAWNLRANRSRFARLVPWLVTVLAVAYIVVTIPWRDSMIENPSEDQGSTSQSGSTGVSATPSSRNHQPGVHWQPGVLTLLGRIRWPWITAYLVCMIASGSLLVVRWHTLLKRIGAINVSLAWCARTWAQAQVFSLLPIGQVGADAFRIERSVQRTSSLGRCSGIIVVERLIGLLALLLVGTAGIAIKSHSAIGYWLLATSIVLAAGTVVVVPRVARRPFHINSPTNANDWRVKVRQWIRSCRDIVDHPHTLARVLVLSILIQTLTPLSFAIVDRALGFTTPVWCYLVAVPAVLLAQFLPIHVAGIGILEGGLGAMLGPWAGRSASEIIALSAMVRIMGLLWSGLMALVIVLPVTRAARLGHRDSQGSIGTDEPASSSTEAPVYLSNNTGNAVAHYLKVAT